MTEARWAQVKALFEAAVERPAPERAEFLRAATGGDQLLRGEVESLLRADDPDAALTNLLQRQDAGPRSVSIDTGDSSSDETRTQTASTLRTIIGPYRVVSLLGAGGMGEVFRARDDKLHRDVALKLLPTAFAFDPDRLARFRREARALAALNHPHIGAIYGLEESGGRQALVLELVEGVTLAERIASGPLPVREALVLASQIAGALEAAHEKGIVHRDLKPANVKVTPAGIVKVLDFGLAKTATGERAAHDVVHSTPTADGSTRVGAVLGTAAYMSPEQARGLDVDTRTDIWAFGCVLFEMLSGRRAFAADADSDSTEKVLAREPDWMALPATTPVQVRGLLRRCLEKDSARRLQKIAEAQQLVNRLLTRGSLTRRVAARLVPVAAIVLAIAVAVGWTYLRRARDDAERTATIADVEHLIDVGRFVDVWRVSQPALQRWPGEARLEAMLRSTTMSVTLTTDPPGADVSLKALDDVSGAWIPVGQTPLRDVRAPLGMLRWRITKAGYDPLEARLEVGTPAAAAGRPDVEAPPIRLRPLDGDFTGMVFVRAGSLGAIGLTDYWLDRTEVTNRDFKAFIDRGGYRDQRYWTHVGEGLGVGATRFRDQTGRPGPATWALGTYAEGRDDYPVSGVSWFEAVAFCRAAGKSLPTVMHWRHAVGATYFMEAVTLGNFGARGPEPVVQLRDLGPWGTSGMAGNVKEWVWNETAGRRYILGGAWNEPVYMAIDLDVRPPLDRAETNGFRCVRETGPSGPGAYGTFARTNVRDYTKETPADASTFEIYRRFYSYDRSPLDPKTERVEDLGEWRRERVSFAAAYGGERMLANILIPKNASPPYQLVIWFPGSYALGLRHSDGDLPFSYYFDFLPKSGRALVYPVYQGTYERTTKATKAPGSSALRDLIVQWSKDLGRTIDYLGSRPDFDSDKIAYYGFSLGAAEALPVVALEPRLKAVILLSGGLPQERGALHAESDAFNFVPRISAPVLFLTGRYDFLFPVETSQRPLFNLLGTPPTHKKHVIFENFGHVPPRLDVIREVLEWLDRFVGPVAHPADMSNDR